MNQSLSVSQSSTFLWQDRNVKQLLKNVTFYLQKINDSQQPFCHFIHKNLKYKQAPFLPQKFKLFLNNLYNIKWINIENFTHGSQMTISLAAYPNGQYTQVYKDKFICKGKTLKKQQKKIDLGALPCRAIEISVNKGCKLSSDHISIIGVKSSQIQRVMGEQYFSLLVINPMKIIYPQ